MNSLAVLRKLDWALLLSVFMLVFLGLITMKSFGAENILSDYFFTRQLVWVFGGVVVFLAAVFTDWSFLKTNSIFLLAIYLVLLLALSILLLTADAIRGSSSWFRIYSINIEPVELMKPVLVLILAKYFSKRHVEIARFTHLFISAFYATVPVALVAWQPDLGSAVVLGALWLGMALVSGIKWRHLFYLALIGLGAAAIFWNFLLFPYQKERIAAFMNPESDIQGSGYQAAQSVIAIGSGMGFGKGVGFGTQSRLEFLPEHATDFIFAAFAEEAGFLGVLILLFFLGVIVWRILRAARYGESNFEKLYAAGLAIFIALQSAVHIGMNAGMLPITGLGMPFLSYGGSSLISLFFALGILESFSIHKKGIFIGSEERFKEGILGA